VIIYLGRRLPAASSDLPGSLGRAVLKRSPIRSCSGWGLPGFPCCHENRWALTSPFHPYLPERRRFAFCGTFLGVAPTGRYPASCPAEFGLSSRA